jgi:vacuolar protein sorting-associated protein 13D
LSQSVLILGSTDFLGNPNGFLNDLSKGVSGLVSDGDVSGLIKNVAHGAANSAAKGSLTFQSNLTLTLFEKSFVLFFETVTGSLSYGISKATVDERYDEKRLMLRRRRGDKSKEYLVAGVKGLAFGMLGGLVKSAIHFA